MVPAAFVLVYTSDPLRAGTPVWRAGVGEATRGVADGAFFLRTRTHLYRIDE